MSAILRLPVAASPACPCCGDADKACECVTCGRCGEVVRAADAEFYAWLGRDGRFVCRPCEGDMERGGRGGW